ncbi:MAG: rod shape-determining protein MreD [Elusimicrobiota bacterium]
MIGIFFYFITGILCLTTQLFSRQIFAEYSPDFFLLLTIYFALFRSSRSSVTGGFFLGILSDSFSTGRFGTQAFVLTLLGFISNRITLFVNQESSFAQAVITMAISALYFIIFFVLQNTLPWFGQVVFHWVGLVVIIINGIVAVPLFMLLNSWYKLWKL